VAPKVSGPCTVELLSSRGARVPGDAWASMAWHPEIEWIKGKLQHCSDMANREGCHHHLEEP